MSDTDINSDVIRSRIANRHTRLLRKLKRMDRDVEIFIRDLQLNPAIQPIHVMEEPPLGYMIRASSGKRTVTIEFSLDVQTLIYSIHSYRHSEDGDIIAYQAFFSLKPALKRLKCIL